MDFGLLSDIVQKLLLGLGGLFGTLKVTSAMSQFIVARSASIKTRTEAENSVKRQDFENYKNTVDTLQNTIIGYASQIDRVVTECENKMEKYQDRIQRLESNLQEKTQLLNETVAEVLKLRTELGLSNERIKHLEIELEKKNRQIEELEKENCKLRLYPEHSRVGLEIQ